MGLMDRAYNWGENQYDRAAGRGREMVGALREVIAIEEDRPLSPEKLLLLLVAAVHRDGSAQVEMSDLRRSVTRTERAAALLGAASGAATVITNLYCDTATVCMLSDHFGQHLTDEDIGAHLLVMWKAMPDYPSARRAMDKTDEHSVAASVSAGIDEKVGALSKRDSLRVLWRMRSGRQVLPTPQPSRLKDAAFVGAAVQRRLEEAAAALDLPADAVAKHGRQSVLTGKLASASALPATSPAPAAQVSAPAERSVPVTPADWYPDPLNRFAMRYFDGSNWTSAVARGGERLDDPVAGVLPVGG